MKIYLYINQHYVTGKKYFGKTNKSERDRLVHKGSDISELIKGRKKCMDTKISKVKVTRNFIHGWQLLTGHNKLKRMEV